MLRVLLVDDNEDLLEVLTVLLSLEAKFDIVAAASKKEALDHLSNRNDIDGIICDYLLQDGLGTEIFEFNKKGKNLPFALFSALFFEDCEGMEELHQGNELNCYIRKSVEEAKLFEFILRIERSRASEKTLDSAEELGFHRLPLSFLKKFTFINADFYVKLRDDHFVKISNFGDDVMSAIANYELKGVHFFFVKIEDLSKIFSEVSKYLIDLYSGGNIEKEIVNIADIQFEISLVALKHMGLKREHLEFINKSLSQSLEKLSKHTELKSIFDKINQNDGIYKNHSLLTLYLATPMIYALGWNSPSTVERIVHAALFHDSFITNINLIDFEDNSDLKSVLNEADIKSLKLHPKDAAENLRKYDFIHLETIKIIQEHHERPDGQGYPAGLSAQHVSALSAAFIIAHDFAHQLIKGDYNLANFKYYLALKKNYYSVGQYKRCFEAFLEISIKILN